MEHKGYYMCAGEVQLDLASIESALASGIAKTRDEVNRTLSDLSEYFRDAHHANYVHDTHAAYLAECHAHTIAPRLVESAKELDNLVQAWFHVAQARVRDVVTIDKR